MAAIQSVCCEPHPPISGPVRMESQSHATIQGDIPSDGFPAEKDRYVLYVNSCCPYAHQTIIALKLKGLEKVIQLVEVDARDHTYGWYFSGRRGPSRDPIYGVRWLRELYTRFDPHYQGRILVPLLWDKKQGVAVSNKSTDIVRMFIQSFDHLLPPEQREATKGEYALIPEHLRTEIDELNEWIHVNVCNTVYGAGTSTTQILHDAHAHKLFKALDYLDKRLQSTRPFLMGHNITEADIILFPIIVRFDPVYHYLYKCNSKMIRSDYQALHYWVRRLYWNDSVETAGGVFRKTIDFDETKRGYWTAQTKDGIAPNGPQPHIMPW